MHREYEEPNIIELDDPVPRGALLVGLVTSIVVVFLVIAPFVITLPVSESTVSGEEQLERATINQQVCRPDIYVPTALNDIAGLALPSWMRMCNWFMEPIQKPQVAPGN